MAMREAFRRAGFQVPDEPVRENMTTQTKTCSSCGETFTPRQPHHKSCDNCFRQQRSPRAQTGQQRSDAQERRNAAPEFPASYFGADDKGNYYLLPEFVAKEKVDVMAKRLANTRSGLTTGQARRFFNHCRDIERRLQFGESWEQVSASFESLSVHAQNAASTRPAKIPRDFQAFIDDNVNKVASAEDPKKAFLDGFLPHFEALVGYGSAYMRDRR